MTSLGEQFRMVDRCRITNEQREFFLKLVSESYPIIYMCNGDRIGFEFPENNLYVKMNHDHEINISYFGDTKKRQALMQKILKLIDTEFPQTEVEQIE